MAMTQPIQVVWLSLHEPEISHQSYWDQAMLRSAMDGAMWHTPGLPVFEHHDHFEDLPDQAGGCVVVVPARWHCDDVQRINRYMSKLGYVLVILTGDEESAFPWRELQHPKMRVWAQTPRADRHEGIDRVFGDGWPPRCRQLLATMGDEAARRELTWSFAGQINNPDREQCHSVLQARLEERHDGALKTTRVFGSGLPYDEYLRLLASSKVVPCPSGSFSPDSFRVFEALEAGCIPIVPAVAPNGGSGYWPFLLGDHPLPVINDWTQFDEICDGLVGDWPRTANRVFSWWQQHKRDFAAALVADVYTLAGRVESRGGLVDQITVLVPTSPIPSHPDTAIIDETVASIRERLPDSEIIIMVDGVRGEQEHRRKDYDEYTRRLLWKANHEWRNVVPVVFDEHLHQAAMTRHCLDMVRTPTLLFVEHDTPLCGPDLPWWQMVAALDGGQVNLIRLHHEASVLEPHRHLMLDTEPRVIAGVPLLRTVQYSQRPHLATVGFYRRIIGDYFGPDARTMIEDVMHGVIHSHWLDFNEKGWRKFRLAMYAPDGVIKRSTHTDGRGEDPKYGMTFDYPDAEPIGAPRSSRRKQPEPAPDVVWHESTPVIVEQATTRVGVFGARADRRGLATQTTEVCRHLHPAAVLGIDMGDLSPYHNDWADYDPATLTVVEREKLTPELVEDWIRSNRLNVIWGAETFYVEWFTAVAKACGARTVLAPNPEFFSHVAAWEPRPDVLAAATRWRIGEMPGAIVLPQPVDRERLPFRQRTKADTFLFVLGHHATRDRQGIRVLWDALARVTEPIRVIVRSQRDVNPPHQYPSHIDLDIRVADEPDYAVLYAEGDVFLHPRRYGGLSLPLLEAMSVGMVPLATDASPQKSWLPPEMLLACTSDRVWRSLVGELALHDVMPAVMAQRINELARDPGEMARLSLVADSIAEQFSWTALEPQWRTLFDSLAASGVATVAP
jgi:glycosyltransferase involved in cell wall biosynthesis